MTNVRSGTKGFASIPLEERFWSKVDRRGPDECWPWLGSTAYRGYGTIYVAGNMRRATQVAWELTHGQPFPEGMMACHSCDNPPCVNPAHIWPGTMRDNILDASRKGRLNRAKQNSRRYQTHCKRGHPLSGDNLRLTSLGRCCKICDRDAYNRWSKRRAEEAQAALLAGIDVTCPKCGQSGANPCLSATGNRVPNHHAARTALEGRG